MDTKSCIPVALFQCSGLASCTCLCAYFKEKYRYTNRHHLVSVTGAIQVLKIYVVCFAQVVEKSVHIQIRFASAPNGQVVQCGKYCFLYAFCSSWLFPLNRVVPQILLANTLHQIMFALTITGHCVALYHCIQGTIDISVLLTGKLSCINWCQLASSKQPVHFIGAGNNGVFVCLFLSQCKSMIKWCVNCICYAALTYIYHVLRRICYEGKQSFRNHFSQILGRSSQKLVGQNHPEAQRNTT